MNECLLSLCDSIQQRTVKQTYTALSTMSWKGLTKAVNRAQTGLMQKVGQVDRTVDSEFQQEEARYRTLEKSALVLQKEAKNYLDSIRGEARWSRADVLHTAWLMTAIACVNQQ